MTVQYIPESPDNKAIREQLEELKKMNVSSTRYNRIIVGLSMIILIITSLGVVVAWMK